MEVVAEIGAAVVTIRDPAEGDWQVSGFASFDEAEDFALWGDLEPYDNSWARATRKKVTLTRVRQTSRF